MEDDYDKDAEGLPAPYIAHAPTRIHIIEGHQRFKVQEHIIEVAIGALVFIVLLFAGLGAFALVQGAELDPGLEPVAAQAIGAIERVIAIAVGFWAGTKQVQRKNGAHGPS